MGLETGDFIDDLNSDWPLGTDPVAEGDDHLRLIKRCLQGNVAGDATSTTLLAAAASILAAQATGSQTVGSAQVTEQPTAAEDLTRLDYVDGADLNLQGQIDTLDGQVTTLEATVVSLQTQIDNILNGTTPFTGDVNGTDWIANGP